LAIK
jgi:hypothetical protein